MPKYICTKWWPRNEVGDVIEHYVWKRLDPSIQKHYFTEYSGNSKKKTKPVTPIPSKPIEPIEVPIQKLKTNIKPDSPFKKENKKKSSD